MIKLNMLFKTSIKSGLVLEEVQGVNKYNQNPWLKPYIDMNTDLRKKSKKRLRFF